MTTTPQWINRIGREHQAEAVRIWEEHREVVRKAAQTFGAALEKLRAKRDAAMGDANDVYRAAKKTLRDRANE